MIDNEFLQYCEFGGTSKKCEEWLEDHHPDLHKRLYSEGQPDAFFPCSIYLFFVSWSRSNR